MRAEKLRHPAKSEQPGAGHTRKRQEVTGARYSFHAWNAGTRRANRLLRHPIAHQPWPLPTAIATDSLLTGFEELGLPVLWQQPIEHYSPGLDTRATAPRLLPS